MARVKLNGYVVSDMAGPIYQKYGYSVIFPNMIRQAIENNPEGEDLVLELNSGGGSVFSGFEIYSVLRGAACNTVAEIQSLAGSAASTIACGCRQVLMSPVAQLMIHDPATWTDGNIKDHKDSLHVLNAIKESILNGYVSRCGEKCSRTKLRDLMSNETWLPAQQAVEFGLADGILYQDATDPNMVINCAQAGFRDFFTGCALPPVEELQAREERENAAQSGEPENNPHAPAGEAPAQNNDFWTRQAALDIEKNRFV